jgi:hypothetical protein
MEMKRCGVITRIAKGISYLMSIKEKAYEYYRVYDLGGCYGGLQEPDGFI